jgi:hypothetical protein
MRKIIVLLLFLLPALPSSAQSPNYGNGFTSTGLSLNNGATITGNGALQLTDGGVDEKRSAFFTTQVSVQSFTNNFTFQLTNPNADGFTFTIQAIGPTALGTWGGGLGYAHIGSSVAVGFQLFASGQETSLTGDWTNGASPDATPGTSTTGIDLRSSDVMSVHMTYDGTTLSWTITDTATGKSFTQSVAINIPAFTGNTAYVGFTGASGGMTAVQDILTWTFTPGSSPVPPSITTQPGNQTVTVGQTATFSVVATGTAPLSYQWQQNTGTGFVAISGATSSRYTTPPTSSSNSGNTFNVIVTNSAGSVTSNAATLKVNNTPSTVNYGNGFTSTGLSLNNGATITGNGALQLTDGGADEGRTAFFTTPMNVQSFSSNFTFQVTNPNADGFTFTIQAIGPTAVGSWGGGLGYAHIGSSVAVGFQLFASGQETSLTGDWTNGASPDATPGTSTTGIDLHSGDVMSVHMTYDGTTLTWTITDTATGKGFTQSVAINIPALTGNTAYVGFTGGSGGLTAVQDILTWTFTSGLAPSITTQPGNQTVTVGQTATFSVVATGTAPLSYQWQQNTGTGFVAISGATSSSYTTPSTSSSNSGNTFNVIVTNSAGSVTSNAATLTVSSASPVPPSIATQPGNQTVGVGQTATFSVVATGTAPLGYQWQQNTGTGFVAISGATSSSYTTPPTSSSNSGNRFNVIVTNSAGSVTSNAATLTVNSASPVPPSIATQPGNQTVTVGQTATFSVVATGTAPLSYQWQQNTGTGFVAISGATSSSYTTPPTSNSNNGNTFNVIVTNSAGSATSNAATLTVTNTPSTISYGSGFTPTGLSLNNGATITGSAALELTDGNGDEARSAFTTIPVNVQSFVTTFTFLLTNPNADGFTVTIQNHGTTAVGSWGGGLGYAGIPNSVAVGFQLYSAGNEVSLVGLWTNGASPGSSPGANMSSIDLHSGDVFKAIISYSGTTLSVYIRDLTNPSLAFSTSFSINIPGTVGSNTAYIGFTGGDGGLTSAQNILAWSYSSSQTGTSGTFIWPVDAPAFVGASEYSTTAFGDQYHTGIDLCPATLGCQTGDPVYASANGTVQAVYVTSDPAQTMCDGSSTGALPTLDSHLGNSVIISHADGKFSLYGNLDCVWPGIAPGVAVTQGERIANIGNSQYTTRTNTWTPHVHFEIKDTAVVTDPATGTFASFTADLPDGYGYNDPRVYLFPFSATNITPTAVKVMVPFLDLLTGPDVSYSSLGFVTEGQEFVAFASSGSWYEIYLPNSQGPISGWIPASAGSQILAATDSSATTIEVSNTGGAGLPVRPSASAANELVSWNNNSGLEPTVQNCAPSAKVWDGQFFVLLATQNGFNEFDLPSNFYFSSASACAQPSAPGPSLGWASSTYIH